MKSKDSFLIYIFTVVMIFFVLFVSWYLPSVGTRKFLLEDVQKSLETSQGRERKQQAEYDQTVAALPEVEAELERIIPLAEAAKEDVRSLKSLRKELRQEKKNLEATTVQLTEQEGNDHE